MQSTDFIGKSEKSLKMLEEICFFMLKSNLNKASGFQKNRSCTENVYGEKIGGHEMIKKVRLLIALAMSASEDEDAKKALKALPLLKNAEVHLTHVPSNGDISGLRKLGLIYTSDPKYPARNTGKKE